VESTSLPLNPNETIAYFSMEFGLHESIPIFAGGLGVLAGDHLKAASNMALPLTGIGLLYREGYFRQFLDQNGVQQEAYPETNLYRLPLERVRDASGNEVRIVITGPKGRIRAIVWKIMVGRIPLYLLDTNLLDNPTEVRNLTARLYSAEAKTRLGQEVLLGIGGVRALSAMGLFPKVCHMNEGHSAFSSLERLGLIMESYNVDLKTALEIIPRTTVFTTHTPVAAGHDEFPAELVKPYLKPFEERLNTTVEEILSWGQPEGAGEDDPFSMAILGIRMSQYCNGVSQLHGKVARGMWNHVWPKRPVDEVPISHITNGVHVPGSISQELAYLYERYLGPEWYMGSRLPENIRRIADIYDEELWRAHEMDRAKLIRMCREMMVQQYGRRNEPKSTIEQLAGVLDQDALTIGFARRFATYKRANLILEDPDRLKAILTNESFPVQLIFAGKAHPEDNEGKGLIKEIITFARQPELRHKIVFIENYDMHIARQMYQGADVWLNTPRRPFEACGTSGMKAALNGVLNVSILDGWWAEAYDRAHGWRIGRGEEGLDAAYQDVVESQDLYNILEDDVIPTFYARKNGSVPTQWIKRMKASMQMAMEHFCSLRMLAEYVGRFYQTGSDHFQALTAQNGREARNLRSQRARLSQRWQHIQVAPPRRQAFGPYRVGDRFQVTCEINIGDLKPDEVEVQLYYGRLKKVDTVLESHTEKMTVEKELDNGEFLFACSVPCNSAGRYGLTVRVTPAGDEFLRSTPGLITWAQPAV
jgi:starch phosphorylase